jgi:NADH-quinone oxidoreductase subunit F
MAPNPTIDFHKIRQEAISEWKTSKENRSRVLVGAATCGRAAGALEVMEAFRSEFIRRDLPTTLTEVGCIGLCYLEPIVGVEKPGGPLILYQRVSPDQVTELVERWVLGEDPCPEFALGKIGGGSLNGIPDLFDLPMLSRQVRIVLKNCGFIDPKEIKQYIANQGYQGLEKALQMKPEEVIEEIRRSGLRGRGGAGFPTWRKWEICRSLSDSRKYLICNADEGDPGAFMNRSLIEGDPHALLEGILIAGYTIGASEAFIYIRAEYPLAVERLELAIRQLRDYGLLGRGILGSDIDFSISIKRGAGAFVCGEETALISSIEGKRGMPRPRPPFPAVAGLWGKPTVINNVETLATLPHILRNGANWYNQYGTPTSKGTKTFALAGKVERTGLIEVPLGITLRDIVYEIGGGIPGGNEFKAVQTGGPSGGCLPATCLDLPVDYESLVEAGSIMGSGGMIVMDEKTCAVDIARYFLAFTQKESCGKCVPCRVGTKRMLETLERITRGEGDLEELESLDTLAETVKNSSLCGLGQTAPNPVLTTLKYFRKEYETHIQERSCPAGVCKPLITYSINPERCTGCEACKKACPAQAISGEKKGIHSIDQALCTKCGNCFEVCKFDAVIIQ